MSIGGQSTVKELQTYLQLHIGIVADLNIVIEGREDLTRKYADSITINEVLNGADTLRYGVTTEFFGNMYSTSIEVSEQSIKDLLYNSLNYCELIVTQLYTEVALSKGNAKNKRVKH